MPTIRKGDHGALPVRHISYREHTDQARALAAAARESGGNIQHVRARFEFQDPTDLRGIPAIGRGVTGAVRGSDPAGIANR